jgi:hypothetical protein
MHHIRLENGTHCKYSYSQRPGVDEPWDYEDVWELKPAIKEWLRSCNIAYSVFTMEDTVEYDRGCVCLDCFMHLEFHTRKDLMMFKLAWM